MDELSFMTPTEAAHWLAQQWKHVLGGHLDDPDDAIDRFVHSHVTSIRFAVITQLLGKVAVPSRDLLCLQKGEAGDVPGRWDPRSFCAKVIVPWVRDNQSVLGKSGDPYVNNPLRRPRLDKGLGNIRKSDRSEWAALSGFLDDLQSRNDAKENRRVFVRCLHSVARLLAKQTFEYPSPNRVSLDQLCNILDQYLEHSSGGLRPLVVATVLMQTLGHGFSIFSRVESQGLNEPDASKGMPGDIMCYGPLGDSGQIKLAVEVKADEIRLTELQGSIAKARASKLANFLLATPGFRQNEVTKAQAALDAEFIQGMNVYQTPIVSLVRSAFMLLEEEYRARFLRGIGNELDSRSASYADKSAWVDLLTALGSLGTRLG